MSEKINPTRPITPGQDIPSQERQKRIIKRRKKSKQDKNEEKEQHDTTKKGLFDDYV